MNFDEQLRQILTTTDGAQAALLMGMDGISVAEVKGEGCLLSLQEIAVEYSRILSEIIKVAQGNNLGGLTELVIALDKYRLLFRFVNPNYFILLLLSSEGNLGRGRYLLRRSLPDLQIDL